MTLRMLLVAIFFLSVVLFPWYLTALFALALVLLADAYEVILGGLLLDMLYAAPVPAYFNTTFIFTACFTVLFIAAFSLKRRLVFYHDAHGR